MSDSCSIRLDMVGAVPGGVVDPCTNHLFAIVHMAAAVCVCPFSPVFNFAYQIRAG